MLAQVLDARLVRFAPRIERRLMAPSTTSWNPNPAQYVPLPKVQPAGATALDRAELGTIVFTAERFDDTHAALEVLPGLNGLRGPTGVCDRAGGSGRATVTPSLAFRQHGTATPGLWQPKGPQSTL